MVCRVPLAEPAAAPSRRAQPFRRRKWSSANGRYRHGAAPPPRAWRVRTRARRRRPPAWLSLSLAEAENEVPRARPAVAINRNKPLGRLSVDSSGVRLRDGRILNCRLGLEVDSDISDRRGHTRWGAATRNNDHRHQYQQTHCRGRSRGTGSDAHARSQTSSRGTGRALESVQ